ncbi:hypothetical protein BU17DRAFT_61975 [Hysterangium stoloniferum]|nr:hypothetical protein BU17DRAFT_70476 [Hysterangium stoloniferum]KAF8527004.1 hypothetical protein BU17DRAFT_61975 [Hysterangium stoloniferum]
MSNFIIPIPHWQACDPTSGSWGLFQEMQNKTDLADSKQTLGLGFSGDGYILSAYRKDGIDVLTLESELYHPMGSGKPPDNSKRPPYVLLLDLPCDVEKDTLYKAFGKYGKVISLKVDLLYGHMIVSSEAMAQDCVKYIHGQSLRPGGGRIKIKILDSYEFFGHNGMHKVIYINKTY